MDLQNRSAAAAGSSTYSNILRRTNVTIAKNAIAFDDCLEKFFELEHLPATEKLDCDYCKSKQQVTK